MHQKKHRPSFGYRLTDEGSVGPPAKSIFRKLLLLCGQVRNATFDLLDGYGTVISDPFHLDSLHSQSGSRFDLSET